MMRYMMPLPHCRRLLSPLCLFIITLMPRHAYIDAAFAATCRHRIDAAAAAMF